MKTPLERFYGLLRNNKKEISNIYVYAIFHGVVYLSLPLGVQAIINLIQGGRTSTSWMILIVLVIGGIILTGYLKLLQIRISENLQQKIFAKTAFEFTYRIPRIKFEALYKAYAPELMNRLFDVLSVQKGLSKVLLEFPTAALQILFGLILLSLYHPLFISFSFVLLILVYAIFKLTIKRGIATSLSESKFKYSVVHWLEELARVRDTFKLAGTTELPNIKTNENVHGYLAAREDHYQVLRRQYIILIVFKSIISATLLIAGGILVFNQQMNIGQFVAAEIIILLMLESIEKLILSLESIYDVLASLEKIGQVTDLPIKENEGTNLALTVNCKGLAVEMHQVNFSYPEQQEKIIKNFSIQINEGERICIDGENGSGKTTLLYLLAGIIQPQSGSVIVNNLPLGNYNYENFCNHLGNNLANEILFQGTLMDNITLLRAEADIESVLWAVNELGLSNFIKSLPLGLNTKVDAEGANLPGSIIQKIILCRMIVTKPKLILLKSGLNFIEPIERKKIIDFLVNNENNWTLIAASADQYLSSRCDRKIILN
ncbi:MAG: hypothetical protein RIQ89_4 [Bacteroidota bacterium]|jgi:ABC-type bacteriocin/lantibiotic exporter with double-glycine peptidase domain